MKITVTGVSQVKLPAECVGVDFALGFSGPSRSDVVARTGELISMIREGLSQAIAGGKGRDLKINALRTWTSAGTDADGHPGETQHHCEARGQVTLDDLTIVSPLLGELAATDGVRIAGLDWRLSEETVAHRQPEIIGEAFRSARQRAGWIAAAAGLRRVEAEAIRDDGAPALARFAAAPMMRGGAAPSLDLDPADVELSAHLSVDFVAS